MCPAHEEYTSQSGVNIVYTGAFAAALGKSLLTGSGHTEVFAGRVLALAQNLRKAGKMLSFRPLCFTSYVIAVLRGNPARIQALDDLARPGGQAVMGLLKASGLTQQVLANVPEQGTCVQRSVENVTSGNADAMIVERRICRMQRFADHLDVVEIPEKFFPAGPLTFTVGLMADAADKNMAAAYIDWLTGPQGQAFFEHAGFIPALSSKGQEMIEKLGVKDVA